MGLTLLHAGFLAQVKFTWGGQERGSTMWRSLIEKGEPPPKQGKLRQTRKPELLGTSGDKG